MTDNQKLDLILALTGKLNVGEIWEEIIEYKAEKLSQFECKEESNNDL